MINDKENEEVLQQESGEGTESGLSPKLNMFIEVIVGSKKNNNSIFISKIRYYFSLIFKCLLNQRYRFFFSRKRLGGTHSLTLGNFCFFFRVLEKKKQAVFFSKTRKKKNKNCPKWVSEYPPIFSGKKKRYLWYNHGKNF